MASAICCTAPKRPHSPESPPVNFKHRLQRNNENTRSAWCCPTDERQLHEIFVTASLPEDHPHAFRLPGRKPAIDESIIRSPSLGIKLRRQLSRNTLVPSKSLASLMPPRFSILRRRSGLRGDRLSVEEILTEKSAAAGGYDLDALSLHAAPSLESEPPNNSVVHRTPPLPSRPSVVSSFDSLVPARDRYAAHSAPTTEANLTTRQHDSSPHKVSPTNPVDSTDQEDDQPTLRRSFSEPAIQQSRNHVQQERRLSDVPVLPELRPMGDMLLLLSEEMQETIVPDTSSHPAVGIALTTSEESLAAIGISSLDAALDVDDTTERVLDEDIGRRSSNSVHLYNMRIHEHLRARSQRSDTSSFYSARKPGRNLPAHFSLNSVALSAYSKHHRQTSSAGFSNIPPAWGNILDTSSSVYSQLGGSDGSARSSSLDEPYALCFQDLRVDPDWPLTANALPSGRSSAMRDMRNRSPSPAAKTLTIESYLTAHFQSSESGSSDLPAGKTRLASNSSSSSLGKRSRFKEDLRSSPSGKKHTKQKRSILRFLLPIRHRTRTESQSITLLLATPDGGVAIYDGPADEQGKLAVPQLAPSRASLSSTSHRVSLTSVPDHDEESSPSDPSQRLTRSNAVRRQTRSSLEDYERTLTVQGDDRRRKSAVNIANLQSVQADDRRESEGLKPLARASPLFGPQAKKSDTLMEKALHKHRLEKAALFRSSSKKSNVSGVSEAPSVFSTTYSVAGPETPGRTLTINDDIDPLQSVNPYFVRKTHSMFQLRPTVEPSLATSKNMASIFSLRSRSAVDADGQRRSKIPLASWSRFPSHTRHDRCASAGLVDNVRFQDFAYQADLHALESVRVEGTLSSRGKATPKRRSWLPKPRSATFGTVVRYYTNLFTSPIGQNRRSSIATGGKLRHPELELIGPVLPEHHHHHHVHANAHATWSTPHLGHFVDHVKNDAHELQDMASRHIHPHHPAEDGLNNSGQTDGAAEDKDEKARPQIDGLGYDAERSLPTDTQPEQPHLEEAEDEPVEEEEDDEEEEQPARRWSRLYQTYVRLPASLDAGPPRSRAASPSSNSWTSIPAELELTDTVPSLSSRHGFTGRDTRVPSLTPTRISPTPKPLGARPKSTALTGLSAAAGLRVRKFPSVTVVDDRKGHWRSVSLISVRSGKSTGAVRASTNDLLELLRKAEGVERERLVRAAEAFGENMGIVG